MGRSRGYLGLLSAALSQLLACAPGDPAERFIRRMDGLPPEQRLPHWDRTRALMMRPAPAVGDLAPDFTLSRLDGAGTYTLSDAPGTRPTVLILASYT